MDSQPIELHPLSDTTAYLVPQLRQLSFRDRQVLSLELQGLRKTDIAVRLGLHPVHVSNITLAPNYLAARDALLDNQIAAMIRGLLPQAVRTLEDGLHSRHEHIRLAAAGMTFKILGYMHHGKECEAHANGGITAEDVCRQLLLAARPPSQPLAAQMQEQQEPQEIDQAQAAAL
jgi:hypothetical protein